MLLAIFDLLSNKIILLVMGSTFCARASRIAGLSALTGDKAVQSGGHEHAHLRDLLRVPHIRPSIYLLHRMHTTIEVRVVQLTRFLLQRNKLVSTNTGAAVAGGLVSHGELGKVVADHFSLRNMREGRAH